MGSTDPSKSPSARPTLHPSADPTLSIKSPTLTLDLTETTVNNNEGGVDGDITTTSVEENVQPNYVNADRMNGSTVGLIIVSIILLLVLIGGGVYCGYKRKKELKKMENDVSSAAHQKMNRLSVASSTMILSNDQEGMGDGVQTGDLDHDADTLSENEFIIGDVEDGNDEIVTMGGDENGNVSPKSEGDKEKRMKKHTFVIEDDEDLIPGSNTREQFGQQLGDNVLGQDMLMDDIVHDMDP